MATRILSYTEVSTALTCEARHAFGYTGHLSDGDTLKPRGISGLLSDGSAWGAAVAAWHSYRRRDTLDSAYDLTAARMAAYGALHRSYEKDVRQQLERGYWVEPEVTLDRLERLLNILDHYMLTEDRLEGMTWLEGEINVPILGRNFASSSNRYRYLCYLDGFVPAGKHSDAEILVEFKLRTRLTSVPVVEKMRQLRWSAWARQRQTGRPVVGYILDERLKEAPRLPFITKQGRVSNDKRRQAYTSREQYERACKERDQEPDHSVLESLRTRMWGQRVSLVFSPGELEEAGRELVSAAEKIRDLDSGRYPIRNAQSFLCRNCDFERICARPHDRLFVDVHFERTVPKRRRSTTRSSSAPIDGQPDHATPTLPRRLAPDESSQVHSTASDDLAIPFSPDRVIPDDANQPSQNNLGRDGTPNPFREETPA